MSGNSFCFYFWLQEIVLDLPQCWLGLRWVTGLLGFPWEGGTSCFSLVTVLSVASDLFSFHALLPTLGSYYHAETVLINVDLGSMS